MSIGKRDYRITSSIRENDGYTLPYLQGQRSINCICPRCGRKHRALLFWTGRGIPRIFCELCKKKSEKTDTDECSYLNAGNR